MELRDDEAVFKIVVIGTTDPIELVRALHGSAKPEHRGELDEREDPSWSTASFDMRFPSLKVQERPVRAALVAHRGSGLRTAESAQVVGAFAGTDVVIVRTSSDPEDDLNTAASMVAQAEIAPDAIVVVESRTGTASLQSIAPARFAPRTAVVQLGESTPLDVLKLAIKAMLARESRRAAG